MLWSVGFVAQGDPEKDAVVSMDEIVELADAVAGINGIATGGGGDTRYGAQIMVQAETREEALAIGREEFGAAVRKAGLPGYPIVREEIISEEEDAREAREL